MNVWLCKFSDWTQTCYWPADVACSHCLFSLVSQHCRRWTWRGRAVQMMIINRFLTFICHHSPTLHLSLINTDRCTHMCSRSCTPRPTKLHVLGSFWVFYWVMFCTVIWKWKVLRLFFSAKLHVLASFEYFIENGQLYICFSVPNCKFRSIFVYFMSHELCTKLKIESFTCILSE